ncbi:head-tail adaptor protein [Spirillospora sp. NPDC048911]|uniref:phage head completion protein n=1 Tax=Spirillospora sp. NPDC048911 TaxID=3364527 RepID=UPI00371A3E41
MLGPHTVTVIHPAGRDRWGDTVAGGTETAVSGCFWQPVSSSEQQIAADTVDVVARLFMPAAVDVRATDRIRFEGRTYAVEGRPALHHTPAGPHHYELELRDVEG